MSKKIIILASVFLGLGLLSFLFKDKINSLIYHSRFINPKVSEQTSKKEESKFNWVSWQDSAGFSFEYPEEAQVNPHQEDQKNYSHLELIKVGKKGKIVILCHDSQYQDVNEWFKKDELVKGGSALDTKVASLSAKKVGLGEGRELAGFIDLDQVMYTIELLPEGEDYWRPIFSHILNSFKLTPLEGETEEDFQKWSEGFDTSGADVVEPVEMVE